MELREKWQSDRSDVEQFLLHDKREIVNLIAYRPKNKKKFSLRDKISMINLQEKSGELFKMKE